MDKPDEQKTLGEARRCLHNITSMLTGISAGLVCGRDSDDYAEAKLCIQKVEALLDETRAEVKKLNTVLRGLDSK